MTSKDGRANRGLTPHPTCLDPDPLEAVETGMATLAAKARPKILGENACRLYRL